jgi:peptidoglycan/LPS O-acetylase OafA/YrhL
VPDAPRRREHFDLFDPLRILAAIAVIYFHSYRLTGRAEPVIPVLGRAEMTYGGLAVGAFFAISGFLVTMSFLRSTAVSRFVRNRVARIWPGLLVAVTLTAFVVGPLTTVLSTGAYLRDPHTILYWARNTLLLTLDRLPGVFGHTFLPGAVNGSLWTLPFELVAYLGVLVLGMAGALRQRYVVLGLAAVTAVIVAVLDVTELPSSLDGVDQLPHLMLFFLVGAVSFLFFDVLRPRRVVAGSGALLVVALAVVSRLPAAAVVGFAVLVVLLGTRRSPAARILRRAGDPSYGTYIYAFLIQQLLVSTVGVTTPVRLFLLAVPLSLTAGYLSWHLIEEPVLRRVKRSPGDDRPSGRRGSRAVPTTTAAPSGAR